jgi:penicillin G amidase
VLLNRLLKYINLLVAVLLCIALAVVYWFGYRVLPKTSGTIRAPLSAPATVARDSLGVPHIQASSIEDALFLQGYVTAQDRLFQMELLRRLAAGELSELFGPAALEADRDARRFRLRRVAEEQAKRLDPKARVWLTAYARGVNYFMETHQDALPIEFTLQRYKPRPWSVVDTLLIGMQMYRTLTTTWQDDIQKMQMLRGGDAAMVNALFPVRSESDFQPGSNSWAVSGKRTASGKPILANDPHLEYGLPSIWYLIHLQAPGLNVAGASIPGAPSVVSGHNDRISWGVTNLGFDVEDLYIERMNVQTGQYLFQGQVQQARVERELIPVKGQKPVEMTTLVTRHGPVWTSAGNQIMSLRWVAGDAGNFSFPWIDIDRARNWEEFRQALGGYGGPGQNFVYADVDGNIGYQAAGKLPIRKNFNGDVPVDGSSGQFEWDGFIPFEELPTAYNPPSGMVITANQNPFPADYKYPVNGKFASYYRAHQIRDLLSAKTGWKPEDMLVVQKDVYSGLSDFIAKQVIAAYDKRGATPGLADAADILRKWNGQMEKDEPAPFLVSLIYQYLRKALAERASPGKGLVYDYAPAGAAIERILRGRPREWSYDYDQLLLRCFVDAVEEGRRIQGKNVTKWRYGSYVELTLRNPILGQIPWVGKYFNIGPVPMSGSPTTVKQLTRTSGMVGPSLRLIDDTGDWERSLEDMTTGQSGQFLSSHYRDQWDAYYSGRSFPMRFGKVDGSVLRVEVGRE